MGILATGLLAVSAAQLYAMRGGRSGPSYDGRRRDRAVAGRELPAHGLRATPDSPRRPAAIRRAARRWIARRRPRAPPLVEQSYSLTWRIANGPIVSGRIFLKTIDVQVDLGRAEPAGPLLHDDHDASQRRAERGTEPAPGQRIHVDRDARRRGDPRDRRGGRDGNLHGAEPRLHGRGRDHRGAAEPARDRVSDRTRPALDRLHGRGRRRGVRRRQHQPAGHALRHGHGTGQSGARRRRRRSVRRSSPATRVRRPRRC